MSHDKLTDTQSAYLLLSFSPFYFQRLNTAIYVIRASVVFPLSYLLLIFHPPEIVSRNRDPQL